MDFQPYMEKALRLGVGIDSMLTKASDLLNGTVFGNRYYALASEVVFGQSQLVPIPMLFNVPKSNDFRVRRLTLLPFVRLVSPDPVTQGPSERTFRPTFWVWTQSGTQVPSQAVDVALELLLGDKPLQNAPYASFKTFSGNVLQTGTFPFANYAVPSGQVFDPPFTLRAGEALTARITPLFAGPANTVLVTDGRLNEYKIVGVLEGEKVLK